MNRFGFGETKEEGKVETNGAARASQIALGATGVVGGLAALMSSSPQISSLQNFGLNLLETSDSANSVLQSFNLFFGTFNAQEAQAKRDYIITSHAFGACPANISFDLEELTEVEKAGDRGCYCYNYMLVWNGSKVEIREIYTGVNYWSKIALNVLPPVRAAEFENWVKNCTVTGLDYVDLNLCDASENMEKLRMEFTVGIKKQWLEVEQKPTIEQGGTSCDFYGFFFKELLPESGEGKDGEMFKSFQEAGFRVIPLIPSKDNDLNIEEFTPENKHHARIYQITSRESLQTQCNTLKQMIEWEGWAADTFMIFTGPKTEVWCSLDRFTKDQFTEESLDTLNLGISGFADYYGSALDNEQETKYKAFLHRGIVNKRTHNTVEIFFPKNSTPTEDEPHLTRRGRMFLRAVGWSQNTQIGFAIAHAVETGKLPDTISHAMQTVDADRFAELARTDGDGGATGSAEGTGGAEGGATGGVE